MMTDLTLTFPDIAGMDDDEVAEFHLASGRDGKWSDLTRWLMQKCEAGKLDLNKAWAANSRVWECPACGRAKVEIARKSDDGVLICRLEEHHDHLCDLALERMKAISCGNLELPESGLRRSACAAALPLIERFARTYICADYNAADAAMKAALGSRVHPRFSFSPSEIRKFVRPRPNAVHEIDREAGLMVWEVADAQFHDRLDFACALAERINEGRHDREALWQESPDRVYDDARLLSNLVSHQAGPRANVPKLGVALLARSVSVDSLGTRKSPVRPRAALPPTDAEFELIDIANSKSPPWQRAASD